MKRIFTWFFRGSFVLAAILALGSTLLLAHHGRGATYAKTELSLKGTVKEVLWRNPHIAIFLDVKDDSGKVTTWAIEHSNVSRVQLNVRVTFSGRERPVFGNSGVGTRALLLDKWMKVG